MDRISGEAVKYRLIENKPVVYSVGMDRINDGGRRPGKNHSGDYLHADQWGKQLQIVQGDWVLYPPDPSEDR